MVRRVIVVVALAACIAGVALIVVALAPRGTARSPAQVDVYTKLAQQLKAHLQPLAPAKPTTNNALPSLQQTGYSCAVATTNGCSLQPCVKYVQSAGAVVSIASTVAAPASSGCRKAANAVPSAVPINAP